MSNIKVEKREQCLTFFQEKIKRLRGTEMTQDEVRLFRIAFDRGWQARYRLGKEKVKA